MIKTNFHTHTSYCDGNNTPIEMAQRAYSLGMTHLGFSGHSYVTFDDCCMSETDTESYCREVKALKDGYLGKMKILLGIEKDYYSDVETSGYDYVIGSVHYLKIEGKYYPVDYKRDIVTEVIDRFYNGDPYKYVKAYYSLVSDLFSKVDADIIGHIDLITKFDDLSPLFDIEDKRYKSAWMEAVDALIPYGKPFEINTGAMSRGLRKTPYPYPDVLRFIGERGGHIVISSDTHSAETILFGAEEARALAIECGFRSQLIPSENGLVEIEL